MKFDVSELIEFAGEVESAANAVPGLLQDAAQSLGEAGKGYAVLNAKRRHTKYATGTMANEVAVRPLSASYSAASVEVVSPTVSGQGFPYPIVADQGHGGIVAKKGKALAIPIGGDVIFRKSVKPYRGSRWFSDAAETLQTSNDGQLAAELFADDLLDLLRD